MGRLEEIRAAFETLEDRLYHEEYSLTNEPFDSRRNEGYHAIHVFHLAPLHSADASAFQKEIIEKMPVPDDLNYFLSAGNLRFFGRAEYYEGDEMILLKFFRNKKEAGDSRYMGYKPVYSKTALPNLGRHRW